MLSFHGWAGTGKNFVSNITIKNIFKNGMESHFVYFVLGPHALKKQSQAGEYGDYIHDLVTSSVGACSRSLFFFDDIDHIPDGVLDALVPFIMNTPNADNIDFRISMFIFLSNAGSHAIYELTLKHVKEGKRREDLKLHNVEHLVTAEVYGSTGGLHGSQLIEKHLISHFIPFLPMEREHIKQCIRADIARKGYHATDQIVNEVADMM